MHDRGRPRRSGHGLWDSITGVLRGLANALNALDYLVLALLLVALPFVMGPCCPLQISIALFERRRVRS